MIKIKCSLYGRTHILRRIYRDASLLPNRPENQFYDNPVNMLTNSQKLNTFEINVLIIWN